MGMPSTFFFEDSDPWLIC